MEMKITTRGTDSILIQLEGQLDTLAAQDFEKEVRRIVESKPKEVVLDAGALTYISSAGLRLLLTLEKSMKNQGGQFRLRNVRDEVKEILDITGFSSILTIE
jgi:anti-sigma B factor antagonist/stage II sporulation protein AA (anti-sigma F factor antagonist)